ncbi:MAG TPA: SPFH domain-containing protein [Clostridiales bacterium]|jgi:regulator of protease activity HflC (stomatin/prohibitin superfamily)|nr:SPFH domain-containing protein [Clostridiales bacterium]
MNAEINKNQEISEFPAKSRNGIGMLFFSLFLIAASIGAFVFAAVTFESSSPIFGVFFVLAFVILIVGFLLISGLRIIKPNEAVVLTLFGKYIGTLRGAGMHFVNPFSTAYNPAAKTRLGQSGDVRTDEPNPNNVEVPSKKIPLKVMTLSNNKQKINDALGTPVEIGIAVMWRVVDTAKAVFKVENFKEFLSLQCDSSVRNIVRIYPYDVAPNIDTTGDGLADDGSLRGSSEIVVSRIRQEIQSKVEYAGLEIIDARITYLAYAPEIASAMLQRQQASAIIDARKMIVEGAVSMVQMALEKIEADNITVLDEERKAQMVSNLLVVLCGSKDAQPIINSGSIY